MQPPASPVRSAHPSLGLQRGGCQQPVPSSDPAIPSRPRHDEGHEDNHPRRRVPHPAASAADAREIHELISLCDTQVIGKADMTLDDVADQLNDSSFDRESDGWLVHDETGRLVAWAGSCRGVRRRRPARAGRHLPARRRQQQHARPRPLPLGGYAPGPDHRRLAAHDLTQCLRRRTGPAPYGVIERGRRSRQAGGQSSGVTRCLARWASTAWLASQPSGNFTGTPSWTGSVDGWASSSSAMPGPGHHDAGVPVPGGQHAQPARLQVEGGGVAAARTAGAARSSRRTPGPAAGWRCPP